MKHSISVSAAVCLLGAALFAQKTATQREQWNRPAKPFHVIGNIYFVGTEGLGSFLITSPQGDVLLDGGLPESAPLIEKNVAALGFRMSDVKFLLNSHAHFDHAGGLAALKRASGARMLASRADAAMLEKGFQTSYGAGWDSHFPAVHVDGFVNDGYKVQLGNIILTAHLTPGHTKGCTTWTMPVTESGKSYNVVFYCSTSVPGYSLVHNREYPEIVKDYEHSFAELDRLPCDVFLANHTGFFRMQEKLAKRKNEGPNPFIDSAELHNFVQDSKAEFEALLKKQSAGT